MVDLKRLALFGGALSASSVSVASSGLVLEEIMVTAQRVVESVQTVPVTVNAISGDTFKDIASSDIRDLARLTPGLALESTGNNQNVTLRGVGTKIGAPQSPRTNIFVDGSYQMQQQNAFFSQFDLERFEVLRGPQGTLYGKASPTGTIVIHTANPDLGNLEGYARQTFGQQDLSTTEFGVSLPIIEGEMGVRVSGLYDENNSRDYQYALPGLPSEPKERTRSGRVTWLWEPSDYSFDMRLSYTHVQRDSSIDINVTETLIPIPGSGLTATPFDRESLSDRAANYDIEMNQVIYEFNYDFDDLILTYQGYYAEATNDSEIDRDASPIFAQNLDVDINLSKLFNNEVRLASEGNEFWDWITGVYYANTSASTDTFVDTPLQDIVNTLDSTNEDLGIFSHNTLFLNDQWTLTFGARWSREKRYGYQEPQIVAGGMTIPRPAVEAQTKWIDWTGTTKIAYEISPDELVYATVDFGGRSGGSGIDFLGTAPPQFNEYDPESSTSYELGYKSDLMDGRLRFNAAAYYQIYKDYQVQRGATYLAGPIAGRDFIVIQNAKEVISSGAEVELTFLVAQSLQTNLSVSYNDTKFEEFTDAVCRDNAAAIVYGICDLSGERIGGDSGNWGVVAGANYSVPLMNTGFDWYLDGLMNFDSFRVGENTRRRSPSYATFDLFTGVRNQDWDVKVWAKNIFDKEALAQNDITSSVPIVIPHQRVVNPRQVGITVNYSFN